MTFPLIFFHDDFCDLCCHVQSEARVRAAVRLGGGGMTVAFRPQEEPGNQLQ